MLSPIADGPLESDSWRNALIFIENTIRYLRFQACLMNKPGERFARASINRHSDVFSVAILDIDHFKPINDTYGHAVGDEVLQQLALLLSSQMRGSDLAARIGGEEFALLMPETSLEEASHALERLRLAIEAHTWQPVPITASIGVAGYQAGDTKENLMARADRALYKAKHLGRNHVAKS